MDDPYKVLGVNKSSSPEEIKSAFRKLAIKTHPDKTGGDDTEFKKINQAYELLSDPDKKMAHDSGFGGMNNAGGFESFFNMFHHRHANSVPVDPFQVTIPLPAIVNGTKQRITVTMPHACECCSGRGTRDDTFKVVCGKCDGSGKINQILGGVFSISIGRCEACKGKGKIIPSAAKCKSCEGEGVKQKSKIIDIEIEPGTRDGHSFLLKGLGGYDTDIGANHDVQITVRWNLPDNIRIYGKDIHTTIKLTLDEVLKGFTHVINNYGTDINIVQSGYKNPSTPIVKSGAGIDGGDMVINIDVVWPEKLS